MTKQELLEILRRLSDEDPVTGHREADTALLDYIGDEEIREAFENVPRWYS